MSIRAVIYARQSKDPRGDAAAVDRQLEECRELVASNGWDVAREIVDNDRSATRGERPGWRKLLGDIEAGQYDVLVAWHPDRLYRRLRDLVELLTVAEKTALRIAAVKSGDLDLSTPTGRMVAGLVGSVAEYEVAHKGQRQRASNEQRARAGYVGWTLRPYGYDKVDGRVVVVEHEATVLREVARRVLAGEPMRLILANLKARDVKTTTGGPWKTTPLRRVLMSPRVAGRAVLKGKDYGPAAWPPILDLETHDRLVALFRDPRRKRETASVVKNLLSGLLICGRCGGVMYAAPARKRHSNAVYLCQSSAHLSRRKASLDEYIQGVVIDRLSRDDALDLFIPDVDVDALRAQATELGERRDAIAALIADGAMGREAGGEQARKLSGQVVDLRRSIAIAESSSPAAELAAAVDVQATWDAFDLPIQREVIKTLMEITVHPTRPGNRPFDPKCVEITWRRL